MKIRNADRLQHTGSGSCFRHDGSGRLKVVGNLPYYITQDFLHQLLPLGHLVSHAVLLLQVIDCCFKSHYAYTLCKFACSRLGLEYYQHSPVCLHGHLHISLYVSVEC